MKRFKIISAVVVVLAITVAVLLSNKSRMKAASRTDEIRFLPVTLVQAAREALSQSLSLTGTIVAYNDVPILSETQGKVTKVNVNVGDYVEANTPIVQLDDELKHASFQAAEVNYQKTKRDLERYESLVKDNSVSDAQLEAARLTFKSAEAQYIVARRQYNDMKIKTPIAGVVTSRPVDIGTNVQNNSVVANVIDISRLKVKLNVSERDVFKMKTGDKVTIATDVYPGVTFEGTISTMSSKADDGHTYAVEAVLPNNTTHPLKAGMFGRVSFVSVQSIESLSIPRQALVGSLREPKVFVVENNVAHVRDIVVGGEFDTRIEVLSGLKEGESVVVNGQNNLKDNTPVTILK
jgi:RND family efflux transporter MFP subunit